MSSQGRSHRTVGMWLVVAALIGAALACGPTVLPTTAPPTALPSTEGAPPTEEGKAEGTAEVPEAPAKASEGKPSLGGTQGASGKTQSDKSAGAGPAAPQTPHLQLVNDTDQTVCYVYISQTTDPSWGSDWLGSSETVGPGAERTFGLEAGTWDMLATDCDGNEIASQYAVVVTADLVWLLSASGGQAAGNASLTVENLSGVDLCWLYISPTTSDTWGADWLGSSILPAGSQQTFSLEEGTWDLLANDCNGNVLDEQYGVQISGDMTWTIGGSADGGAASLTLINNSGVTVCYVYISPSTSSEWGSDWLGADTVPSGGSYLFFMDAGTYDLKAEDCSHNVLDTRFGVNVSGDMTWAIGGSADSGAASLTLINNSGVTVCYVYISPSTSPEWGSDWLGADTVPSGGSYLFFMDAGTYDLKAEDCSHNVLDTRFNIVISGDMTWAIGS